MIYKSLIKQWGDKDSNESNYCPTENSTRLDREKIEEKVLNRELLLLYDMRAYSVDKRVVSQKQTRIWPFITILLDSQGIWMRCFFWRETSEEGGLPNFTIFSSALPFISRAGMMKIKPAMKFWKIKCLKCSSACDVWKAQEIQRIYLCK